MASRLIAAKLENIQSWKDDSQVIHFNPDVVNVIRAQSETGKSVFFKVFYQMVFPNYYKYKSKNDLIRKGCKSAQATYWLENGTIIKFYMEHSTQHFEMQKDGEKNKVYYNAAMPQEIIDEFGLIVDNNLKFILNIFTKDNQYPFVTTAKSWNASALNQVFCDQEVENALINLKIWERELKEKMTAVKQVYDYRKRLSGDLVYTDIDEMRRNQVIVKEISKQYSAIDDILAQLKNLEKAHELLQKYNYEINNVVEINDIRKLMIVIDKIVEALLPLERNLLFVDSVQENTVDMVLLNKIKDYLVKLNQIAEALSPLERNLLFVDSTKENKIDMVLLNQIKDYLVNLDKIFESLEVIAQNQNIVESIPDITDCLQTISGIKDYLIKAFEVYQAMQQLSSQYESYANLDQRYTSTKTELDQLLSHKKDIDAVEEYHNKLNAVYAKSKEMFEKMNSYIVLYQKAEETKAELDRLKVELKVCPTCNRPFEESAGGNND